MEPPKIVFCLPGSSYSGRFLNCWTSLIRELDRRGMEYHFSQQSSCNIYYVRNMCLGGCVSRGENQLPFDACIPYTHTMWIDSDMVFEPSDFFRLLDHDKDIVSGIYKTENGTQYATVLDWDEEYFSKNYTFKFLDDEQISISQKTDGLIKASYTGFGWILIKRAVLSRIKYPWFSAIDKIIETPNGTLKDFTMEDVSFCLKAQNLGYDIWIDPTIKLGHEKVKVIV